jgi:hypothetical protein
MMFGSRIVVQCAILSPNSRKHTSAYAVKSSLHQQIHSKGEAVMSYSYQTNHAFETVFTIQHDFLDLTNRIRQYEFVGFIFEQKFVGFIKRSQWAS